MEHKETISPEQKQILLMSIRQTVQGTNCLRMVVSKNGKNYAIDAHRGDFRDFILEDDLWRGYAQFGADQNPRAGIFDIADDMSYGFLSDGDLQHGYAAQVDLFEDDLILQEAA